MGEPVNLAEARHFANEVHMSWSEWILAARRTIKALCDEVRELRTVCENEWGYVPYYDRALSDTEGYDRSDRLGPETTA